MEKKAQGFVFIYNSLHTRLSTHCKAWSNKKNKAQRVETLLFCCFLTHFSPMFHFYTPENVRKPKGF